MVEEPLKIGNPWHILPIKNAKYARDLIEVHLSDRDLDLIEKFEDFPNLEVIWLNNNKVSFATLRVSHLSCHYHHKAILNHNDMSNNLPLLLIKMLTNGYS